MYHVKRIKLEVVVLVEPGADKVIEPEACASRECQGIDHELSDGLFLVGARLVVEDVDRAVADLEHVDVPSQRGVGRDCHLTHSFAASAWVCFQ